METDKINPSHYKSHPSGVECIEIVETMTHNVGTAMTYLWRGGLKTEDPTEDYRKAAWYIDREIKRLEPIEGQKRLARARFDFQKNENSNSKKSTEAISTDDEPKSYRDRLAQQAHIARLNEGYKG